MQHSEAHRPRLFPSLALVTALMTVGLIMVGGVVRVTDSGLGCGNQWPLCNGTIFPPLDNLNAWIEWLHRLFAALIGVFGILTLIAAIRSSRKGERLALGATITAAILYLLVATLGAITVKLELPPTVVTLHLGAAMLLLAALLTAAISSRYQAAAVYPRDSFTALAYTTTALSFVIILTGALVRGSGATLACLDWPLCNGALFPVGQGQLAVIHMLHRVAVLALGVTLVLLVWNAWSQRRGNLNVRTFALLALVAYLAQAGIGAMYVISRAAPLWGAGHVLFAALTWGALVSLSIIETLNSRASGETEDQWRRQPSERALS